MKQQSGSVNMRVAPVPPGALGGVIGILTSEEEKDNTPFFKVLWQIISDNLKNAVQLIKQHYMWLVPLAALWIWLESISEMSGLFNNPIIKFLIFITATWSTWVGKAFFTGFIGREIVPFIREIKKVGFWKALKARGSRLTRTYTVAIKAFVKKGKDAFIIMLCFGGAGMAVANSISRNNHIDKYLVVLLTALGVSFSLSRGLADPVIRLVRAGWRDILHLFKKDNSKLTVANLFIAMASFALGLILSIIFAFARLSNNFVDYTGYIIGAVLIAAGLAWYFIMYFIGARKNKQQAKPAQPAKTNQPS
jgi:hypothetical protein